MADERLDDQTGEPMMGAEASATEIAWKHVPPRFARFLLAIQPDPAETKAIEATGRDVAALLERRFGIRQPKRRLRRGSATSESAAEQIRVIGGHAKGTAIGGTGTIDLLHVTGAPETASASARTTEVIDLLGERYGAVQVAPPGWLMVEPRCALPHCGRIKVRVLPATASAAGGARVDVSSPRRPGIAWMHLDPAAEAAHLDLMDRLTDGKARHLIRIVKAWRRAVKAPIGGFAIELLAAEFLSVWLYRRRSLLFYDWMVRDFFFWLTLQAGKVLTVPGTGEPLPLGDAWRDAAAAAHTTAARAADLERDNQSLAALGQWRELFGLAIGEGDDRRPTTAG